MNEPITTGQMTCAACGHVLAGSSAMHAGKYYCWTCYSRIAGPTRPSIDYTPSMLARNDELGKEVARLTVKLAELERERVGLYAMIDDMKQARVEDANRTAKAWTECDELRAELIEALSDMVRQNCGKSDGTYHHGFLSIYERAFSRLEELGVMRELPGKTERYMFVSDEVGS